MTPISQIDKHLKKEFEAWEKIQQKELGKLISAKRHLYVNIGAYLLISVIEGILSSISGSQTLKADAFNNLSGIISTVLLIIGIHIASDIDDDDIAGIPLPKISLRKTGNDQRIQFTRWRYETIFTLVTGIIMIVIASSVIIDGIKALLNPSERIVPQPIALLGAAIASIIMILIWIYNKRAGLRLKNAALTASAKDSLSDALTSIGTASFAENNRNFLVYDWRAPISSIFYNGTLGNVQYETPMGIQTTELVKKRQFTIVDGKIRHMFDTNETIGDEMLQAVLGEHSDEYMKNIVATIQKEQNDIIRDTKHDLLLVQGVAGSGKTSAILQRIAFLLYHSNRKLSADQIVLFSPNLLFSHYISEVLPSLGERNMRQVTLAEFFSRRFQGLHVETLFERYENSPLLTQKQLDVRQVKESAEFMQKIFSYAKKLDAKDLKFSDMTLPDGQVIFSAKEIQEIFAKLPTAMKQKDKFLEIKNALIKRLNRLIKTTARSRKMRAAIDLLSDEEYNDLIGKKRRNHFQSLDQEVFYIGEKIAERKFAQIYDGLYNGFFFDVYAQYQDFLTRTLPDSSHEFSENVEFHRISLSDCAPVLYLRDLLTGGGKNRSIEHLFIDEMQDYSMATMIYLKHAFPNAKLTLLGDSEQALFNPLEEPKSLLQRLNESLQIKNCRIIELNTSYRSTKQITDFMKSLLPNKSKIRSFARSGTKPTLFMTSRENALKDLKTTIKKELGQAGTVALITKNERDAEELFFKLKEDFEVTLLDDQDVSVPSGITILPIYLAKGLEFDSVIVCDVTEEKFPEDTLGIFYTICSRAMHSLTLICPEQMPEMLRQIPPELYTVSFSFEKNAES